MKGIERIKILSAEVTDKPLLKIIDYLLSREDMNDKYLNEEKCLSQMISFIKSEAKKQAKDGVAMIEDEVVYSWAIHYWDETNESLKLENVEKIVETKKEDTLKLVKKVSKSTITKPEGQLTLFDFM